jgi:fumarylacetoacetase
VTPAAAITAHDAGSETLPYGVFSPPGGVPRVGVRLGDDVLDLAALARSTGREDGDVFSSPSLNALMELGPARWHDVRAWVLSLKRDDAQRAVVDRHRIPLDSVSLHLPIEVADYVDFYASEWHATNVGKIFRPGSPALPPNWRHLPIGYHGRAGTVVVSGTDVVRPQGQCAPGDDGRPGFGPSVRLDIECEVGFVVGSGSVLGRPVPVSEASEHIFGVVLLNDWSARDIQAWEYVPLGPFLGKSFATSISAWVVPFEALDAARTPLAVQDPPVLPYLAGGPADVLGLDLHLTVSVNGQVVSSPRFTDMYWSPSQMLAHLTVNGASLRVGDLFASGTVSGPEQSSLGSLLELTWNGTRPLRLDSGAEQGFLADGDVVTITGWAPGLHGQVVTLGEVSGRILPATRHQRPGSAGVSAAD